MNATEFLSLLARGEDSRHGTANRRNPTLTEHAVHILPYRGLGTGIPRVLHDWPDTRLMDDVAGNQFKVVMPRPHAHGAPEVTPEIARVVQALPVDLSRQELQNSLRLKDVEHFRKSYLLPALASGLVEMTHPDKPFSSKQRYRLTPAGRQWLQVHSDDDQDNQR